MEEEEDISQNVSSLPSSVISNLSLVPMDFELEGGSDGENHAEYDLLKLQMDELKTAIENQEETMKKQAEIIEKVNTENKGEIFKLKKAFDEEMDKPFHENGILNLSIGSLQFGIDTYKKLLEDRKESHAKNVQKLQAKLKEAYQGDRERYGE